MFKTSSEPTVDDILYRIQSTIEYDGTQFHGWQFQTNSISIQQIVETALYKIFNRKIITFVAGRTDAGVHAFGQVIHFDLLSAEYEKFKQNLDKIKLAINANMRPFPISIISANLVNQNFHARFSALNKTYIYKIINRPEPLTIQKNYFWQVHKLLNIEKIQEATKYLLGFHDFSSFRSGECQAKNALRTLRKIMITQYNNEIHIEYEAQSFLHNQIRIMTGTLIKCGLGHIEPEKLKEILSAKDRRFAGITAPPSGLYLQKIEY